MKTFWIIGVIAEAGESDFGRETAASFGASKEMYSSFDDASAEARKHAVKRPGSRVVVLQAVGSQISDHSTYADAEQ